MEDTIEPNSNKFGRRDVLKKVVVSGAVAGAVWSAPRIEGLTLRPNYASAQSVQQEVACLTFDGNTSISSSTVFTFEIDGVMQPAPTANGGSISIPICGGGVIRLQYANLAYNQQLNGNLQPQGAAGGAGIAADVTMSPEAFGPLNVNGVGTGQIGFSAQGPGSQFPPTPGDVTFCFTYTCGI